MTSTPALALVRRRIRWWERKWRKLLETPEALLLHDRLLPILTALGTRLGRGVFDPANKPDDFRSVLVERLRQALPVPPAQPAFLFDVLATKYGVDVLALRQALHQTPVDAAAVRVPLKVLVRALETDTSLLFDTIERELGAPDSVPSRGRLQAATEALLRRLVALEDPDRLARALEDALATTGLTAALAGATPPFEALWAGVREAARIVAATPDLEPRLHAGRPSEYDLHYLKIHALGRVIEVVTWDTAATPAAASNDAMMRDARVARDGEMTQRIEQLGRDALSVWAGRWIYWVLIRLSPLKRDDDPIAVAFSKQLDVITTLLQSWVRTLCTIDDPTPPSERSDLLPALSDGAERMVRTAICEATVALYRARCDASTARAIGRMVLDALGAESAGLGVEWPPLDAITRERAARRTAARLDVQSALTEAINAAIPELAAVLCDASTALAGSSGPLPLGSDSRTVWSRWTKAVAESTLRRAAAYRCVAWERLPGAPRKALERVAAPLLGTSAYEVVLTVIGVDAQGEAWNAGGVSWYAASRYSLGERVWDGDQKPENVLRAWVRVEAATKADARQRAVEIVEAALSAATFLLSVDTRATGLRPALARFALVGRADGREVNVWGGREREELYEVGTVNEGQFKAATMDAAQLIARMAAGAAPPPLDVRLVRAHAWYRKGRWDANPVTRFLTYFVALEHIFLAEKRGVKGQLPRFVPALAESWVRTRFPEHEILKRIIAGAETLRAFASGPLEAALDAEPAMAHWRDDVRSLLVSSAVRRVVLQLGGAIAANDPGAMAFAAHAARLARFVTDHERHDESRRAVRARWRFTLELLTARRNDIVHEAVTSGPDAQLYVRTLEQGLTSVIKHLQTMERVAHVREIDEAIAWCESPWLQ